MLPVQSGSTGVKPKRKSVPLSAVWVTFKVYDNDVKMYKKVRSRGRRFMVHGSTIDLFSVNVLLRMLNRTISTLRNWEKKGKFPKATYKIQGHKTARYYSRTQLYNIYNLWRKHIPFGSVGRGFYSLDNFFEPLKKDFYSLTVVGEKHPDIE